METPGLALKQTVEKFCYRTRAAQSRLRRVQPKFWQFFKDFWLLGLLKCCAYNGGEAQLCSGQRWENESWPQQAYFVASCKKLQCFGYWRPLEILWEGSCNYCFFSHQLWAQIWKFPSISLIPRNKPKHHWDPSQFEWICIFKGQNGQTELSYLFSSLW